MGYLIAAYAVTFVTLLGYGFLLVRERGRYSEQQPQSQPRDSD